MNAGDGKMTMISIDAESFLDRIQSIRGIHNDGEAITYVIAYLEAKIEFEQELRKSLKLLTAAQTTPEDEEGLFDVIEEPVNSLTAEEIRQKILQILGDSKTPIKTLGFISYFKEGEVTQSRIYFALTTLRKKGLIKSIKSPTIKDTFWKMVKIEKSSDLILSEEDEGRRFVIVKGDLKP